MSCREEIAKLVNDAQEAIIYHNSSDDSWNDPIRNAVIQCTELGNEASRNGLVLIIRDHLKKLRLHAAEPRVVPLDKLMNRPIPQPDSLQDERLH